MRQLGLGGRVRGRCVLPLLWAYDKARTVWYDGRSTLNIRALKVTGSHGSGLVNRRKRLERLRATQQGTGGF